MSKHNQERLLEEIRLLQTARFTNPTPTTKSQEKSRTQAAHQDSPTEDILIKHPGHPDQKVHGNWADGHSSRDDDPDGLDVDTDLEAAHEKAWKMFADGLESYGYSDKDAVNLIDDNRNLAKKIVVEKLSKRLENNQDFLALAGGAGKEFFEYDGYRNRYKTDHENLVNNLIKSWSKSSSGYYPIALAMQRAAAKEFGLSKSETARLENSITEKTGQGRFAGEDGRWLDRLSGDEAQPGLRAFLRAMYDETQSELAKHGIKEITLFRGFAAPEKYGLSDTPQEKEIAMNPMSSYAFNPEITRGFAGWGDAGRASVAITKVPARDIMGSARTGFGALAETEFIVLGRKRKSWAMHIGRDFGEIVSEIDELKKKRKNKQALAREIKLKANPYEPKTKAARRATD